MYCQLVETVILQVDQKHAKSLGRKKSGTRNCAYIEQLRLSLQYKFSPALEILKNHKVRLVQTSGEVYGLYIWTL